MFDAYQIKTLAAPTFTLQPLLASHATELFELLHDHSLYQFVPQDPPKTLVDLQDRYRRLQTRRSPSGHELWLNWIIQVDQSAAGLVQVTCNKASQAFVAYELFDAFRGRGLATKAVQLMLQHIAKDTEIKTALAYVDTRNTRSIRILERLGFTQMRKIEGADYFKGTVSDEYEYQRPLSLSFSP